VNSTTVQTITRIFGRDGGGAKALLQTMEEETQMLPDGSRTVRVVSAPDSDGRPQPSRHEIAETKKISQDVEDENNRDAPQHQWRSSSRHPN